MDQIILELENFYACWRKSLKFVLNSGSTALVHISLTVWTRAIDSIDHAALRRIECRS